jgi:NAD-dependent dihydropyrimidine dehydrogenase PreA subunit
MQYTLKGLTEKYNTHEAYIELAQMFSAVKIMGPPMSEKLIELISHIFTLEEAHVCKHLSFIIPKSIQHVARKTGSSPDEIAALLTAMEKKRVIIAVQKRFLLYPLIPGTFEHILMTGVHTPWHHTYAGLINDLFNTGYLREYFSRPTNAIRNIPVQHAIDTKSFIADADLMSTLVDSHSTFAVLHACSCRQSMHMTGHACKRAAPEDGCLVFGDLSVSVVANGNGRHVSKEEMKDIIADRLNKKLVFLTSNVVPSVQTAICTCCDCCCHALGIYNKFSKNLMAPSHFIADVDESLCNNCGRCVTACNTHAHSLANKKHGYIRENCIGCGMCAMVCGTKAITMIENRSYRTPPKSYFRLILQMMPSVILMGIKIKLNRLLKKI